MNTEDRKPLYIKLLAAIIVCLLFLLSLITFSQNKYIPSWSQIGEALFGTGGDTEDDYVCFLDIGQGDSILISSNGKNAIIDFGNEEDYGSSLIKALRSYNVSTLDCVIASHYDSDHIGGGEKVLKAFNIKTALIPQLDEYDSVDYDNFHYALEQSGAEVFIAKPGAVVNIGDFELTVIGYYTDEQDDNDKSIIIMAEIDGIKFMLSGDAGQAIEKRLMDEGINVDCDVFKAAHHGSKHSNSLDFIKAMSPQYAVISVGKSNYYGHPHDEVVSNFEAVNAEIFRTDVSGDIIFKIQNGNIVVTTEK